MIRLLPALIIFFVSATGYCQSDFHKGFIVSNGSDTIAGFVYYKSGLSPFKSCQFKKTETETPVTYEPAQIKGYGIIGEKYFQSQTIKLDGVETAVFLQVLAKGDVSLYDNGERYFVQKENGDLLELSNDVQQSKVDGRTILKESKRYVGILNLVMQDRPKLKQRIQRVKLDETQLVPLVKKYNDSHGTSTITYKADKASLKITPGIVIGANISKISFKPNHFSFDHLKGSFRVSRAPVFGASFDIFSPRLNENIGFHADVLYGISRYYNYNQITYTATLQTNYTTIDLHQLKIPIGIKYKFPAKKITPYINLGISGTMHLQAHSHVVQEVRSGETVFTTTKQALPIRAYQFGAWAGAGVTRSISKKLVLYSELRYERTDGIINDSADPFANQKCTVSNFQFIVGIRTK